MPGALADAGVVQVRGHLGGQRIEIAAHRVGHVVGQVFVGKVDVGFEVGKRAHQSRPP